MEKLEKYTVFRSADDGEVYAIRNKHPRFTARYLVGGSATNKIEIIDIRDEWDIDPIRVAKLLRGIGEAIARFLKEENHGSKEVPKEM